MQTLTIFWLPILVSAIAVWIASAVAWMFIGHHKLDHGKLPDEGAFTAAIKSLSIPAGNYGFPDCEGHAKMKDPAFQQRWKEGPNGMLSIWGNVSMGRNMVLSFLVYLVISYVIAYLAGSMNFGHPAPFWLIFKGMSVAGILAYSFSFIPNAIWFQAYPRAIAMSIIDGVVYGLITGAIFAGLWPLH